MINIKHTETSFLHYWRTVNRFIIQSSLKVTGITLETLGKESKLQFQLKNITTAIPHSIEFNKRTITDPTAMSNVFNNYFTFIADKTKSNIKFLSKHYTDYLFNTSTNMFFLTSSNKNEIFLCLRFPQIIWSN